jgi:hypothetical protein
VLADRFPFGCVVQNVAAGGHDEREISQPIASSAFLARPDVHLNILTVTGCH